MYVHSHSCCSVSFQPEGSFLNVVVLFQIKQEMYGALDFLKHVYGVFGFTYNLKLSTRSVMTYFNLSYSSTVPNVSLQLLLTNHWTRPLYDCMFSDECKWLNGLLSWLSSLKLSGTQSRSYLYYELQLGSVLVLRYLGMSNLGHV